jgi:carbonic anhydrase
MLTFSNDDLRAKLREEADADASDVDFKPFPNLEESVRESVRTLRESPLLPDSFDVSGWIYDVKSGRITEVSEAA